MIRPGSTSLTDQPGDRPALPSERGKSQTAENVILGADTYKTGNVNSDVREGEEEVPARDHDQDDKLAGEEQAELHNISLREAERASQQNFDGRPSADH